MKNLCCCILFFAMAAPGQPVAAGARSVVAADELPVYAQMSDSSAIRASLKRSEAVTIGLVVFGSDITWCAVARVGEIKRLGYASCEFLEPDRSDAGQSDPAPAAVKEAPKPILVREVPPAVPAAKPIPAPVAAVEATPPPAVTPALSDAPQLASSVALVDLPAPPSAIPAAEPATISSAPAPLPVERPLAAESSTTGAPIPAAPRAQPFDPDTFIDSLLEGSGLKSTIASFTRSINLVSFLDKGRLSEVDPVALAAAISEQFQAGIFDAAIGGQLRKNHSPERVQGLTEWLGSPLAGKMADLERQAFLPEARQELVDFAASLSRNLPSESRLLAIHRVYDATRACDLEVEATIAIVHTIAQAINPSLPNEKRYSIAELDKALGAVKSRYRAIMKNARLVHYLFAFQSVSDLSLEEYAGFWESENGAWLVSMVEKGFFDASEGISKRLLVEIPQRLKARQQKELAGNSVAR